MTSLSIKDFDAAMNLGATSKAGVSKLVQAWEAKNNERTKRAAGLGLMAVSLAACGGSDDTPYSQDDVDALEDEISTLEAARDELQDAIDEATAAIEAAGADDLDDLIADLEALQEELESVNADLTAAEEALSELEADLEPLTGGELTDDTDTIVLLRGTDLSGDAVDFTDPQTDIVIGLGDNTLTLAATADMATTGVASGIDNIVINVAMTAAAGGFDVSLASVANGTVTINTPVVLDLLANDTAEHDVIVTGAGDLTIVAGDSVETLSVTMTADAATIVNTGDATTITVAAAGVAADQTISIISAGDIGLTATGAATLSVSGAGNVTLAAASSDLAGGTISGAAGQTLIAADADDVDGSTVSGFDAIQIDTTTDATSTIDAVDFASEIQLSDGAVVGDTVTVADGATVVMLGADDTVTLDTDDGDAADSNTSVVNLQLASATTAAGSGVTVQGTLDTIGTLEVSSDVDHTAGNFTVTNAAALTVNISGSGDFSFVKAGAGATVLSATSLTGALTASAGATMLSITGGSGNDTITAATGLAFDLDGGAGTLDVLVAVANMTTGDFANFEVVRTAAATTHDFNASQLSGTSLVIDSLGAGSVLSIDGTGAGVAGSVDLATIDLSGLQFADALSSTIVNVSTIDPAQFLNTQSFTITGSDAADAITGSANADTISGGEGIDTIVGGAGADTIDGGAGADDITGGAGNDTITGGDGIDDFQLDDFTAGGIDVITDFAAGAGGDTISFLAGAVLNDLSAEDYSSAASAEAAATLAIADDNLVNAVNGANDVVLFTWDGDLYAVIQDDGDAAFAAGADAIVNLGSAVADDILLAQFVA